MKRLIPCVILLLAACAGADQVGRLQPSGYLPDAQALVDQADWSVPETVSVEMTDYAFTPDDLVFHRGRPALLVLRNTTERDHTFVSTGFFKAIAVRQVASGAAVEPGPYVEKIVVPAGATKEMLFVPGGFGAWNFECDRTGHAMLGMKGVVAVR